MASKFKMWSLIPARFLKLKSEFVFSIIAYPAPWEVAGNSGVNPCNEVEGTVLTIVGPHRETLNSHGISKEQLLSKKSSERLDKLF